jgi:hypothetical protein
MRSFPATEAAEPVRLLVAEATGAGPGTRDRNRVNQCRLPLRDDPSIGSRTDETQYQLSPKFADGDGAIHSPSTTTPAGGRLHGHAWARTSTLRCTRGPNATEEVVT